MKKLLSILLVLSMVFSMLPAAFAEENSSGVPGEPAETVEGAGNGEENTSAADNSGTQAEVSEGPADAENEGELNRRT